MFNKWSSMLFILFVMLACSTPEKDYNANIEVMETFSDLQAIIDAQKSEVLLINFWATTCPPCLKEMPHFNQLAAENSEDQIKVLLVSTDRAKDLESRVYPFVKRLEIKPEVVLLKDQNYSNWTEKIDSSWYGALPATLIIKGDQRSFRFGSYESLEEVQGDIDKVSGD
jgi:thiol-disulfide isomerase/thioredoxin